MISKLAKDYTDLFGRTQTTEITDQISMLTLIDVGRILNINEEGKADVQLMRYIGGMPIVLKDVEVLQIGAVGAGIYVEAGGPCLLFAPRTSLTSILNGTLATIYHAYDERTLKALPIANGQSMAVRLECTGRGLAIRTDEYALEAFRGNITLGDRANICNASLDGEGQLNVKIGNINHLDGDPDGTLTTTRWDADGKIFYREVSTPDGTITIYRNMYEEPTDEEVQDLSTYEKWQWIETFMPDGTHDIIQFNSDGKKIYQDTISPDATHDTIWYDGDDNEVYHVTRNPDGTEDTVSTSPFTTTVSDSDGKEQVVINGTNDGKLSITTEDSVTVNAKGDVVIENEGDVSVTTKGNATVSADGDISLEATKTGLLTLKNSVDSLGSLFAALIDQVNTFSQNVQSIDTVGSPAAHSAGPGIIANMVSLQAQLAQIKQKAGQVLG